MKSSRDRETQVSLIIQATSIFVSLMMIDSKTDSKSKTDGSRHLNGKVIRLETNGKKNGKQDNHRRISSQSAS